MTCRARRAPHLREVRVGACLRTGRAAVAAWKAAAGPRVRDLVVVHVRSVPEEVGEEEVLRLVGGALAHGPPPEFVLGFDALRALASPDPG